MATGNIVVTVTAGAGVAVVNGPASSGGTIADGVYQINIDQNNQGTTVVAVTPVGDASNSSIRNSPSVNS
jgi:hypothetical protein